MDAMEGKRKTRCPGGARLFCTGRGADELVLASSFGDGLRNASVVAPREDSAVELKAHDDPREVEAQIRRAQAAHDAVIAKRLEVATALNAKQSRSQEVSDDEEEEEVKPSPQKQQPPVQDDDDEEHDDVVLELEDVARVTRKGLVRGRFVLTEQSFKWRGPGLCGTAPLVSRPPRDASLPRRFDGLVKEFAPTHCLISTQAASRTMEG